MTAPAFIETGNCVPVERAAIPSLSVAAFREAILGDVADGARLVALWGAPEAGGETRLTAVLAADRAGRLRLLSTVVRDAYPSLTPDCPQAHRFERELWEQWGVRPEGHPWLKPIRFQPPADDRAPAAPRPAIGTAAFFRVEGEEVHEVAVGPVHAGIIEPGHFRFNCHGERVLHLEISLGYQHRGIERRLRGGPDKRTIHYMETLAGDTSVGHALAYCQALEALAGSACPERAQTVRALGLELERIANHIGDLGALAGDVGYQPVAAGCGGLRGDVLNLTAALCGSRLGRGLIRPGGLGPTIDERTLDEVAKGLDRVMEAAADVVPLLWSSSSVRARFERVGIVGAEVAAELGLVGPVARASGIDRDARRDWAHGAYAHRQPTVAVGEGGDVFARAWQRWCEIRHAVEFLRELLARPGGGEARTAVGALPAERMVVSLVEGWRGEICHILATDGAGRIDRYKVVDPSFHNWFALALALRDEDISDFPMCNKSFNLSYCGHDL